MFVHPLLGISLLSFSCKFLVIYIKLFHFKIDSTCSHVAALLLKLSARVQRELNKVACTSQLCAWKKSRTKGHPAPLCKMDLKAPKKNATLPKLEGPLTYFLTASTSKGLFLQILKWK